LRFKVLSASVAAVLVCGYALAAFALQWKHDLKPVLRVACIAALGLALALVHRGAIGPARMVALMALGGARLLKIEGGTLEEGARADITLIDPNMEWTVEPANFISKSRNSPFAGRRLKGRAILTMVAGDVVYDGRAEVRA